MPGAQDNFCNCENYYSFAPRGEERWRPAGHVSFGPKPGCQYPLSKMDDAREPSLLVIERIEFKNGVR